MGEWISKDDLPLYYLDNNENMLLARAMDHAEFIHEGFKSIDTLLKPFPRVRFFVEVETKMKAKASRFVDGTYGIALSYGAIIILGDLFYRMLSYKGAFSDIGNADAELQDKPTLTDLFSDAKGLIDVDRIEEGGKFGWVVPQDIVRQDFAEYLFYKALEFLLLHELYHILNGHVDYMRSGQSQWTFSEEFYQKMENKRALQTKRALEMDADCCACCSVVYGAFIRSSLAGSNIREPEKFQQFSTNFTSAVANSTLAVYSLFRITASGEYDDNNHEYYSHSTPRNRQLGFLSTTDRYIKEKLIPRLGDKADLIDLKEIFDDAYKKIKECERLYNLMTGKEPDRTKMPFTFTPTNQAAELIAEWEEIRTELSKHSFIKIPLD